MPIHTYTLEFIISRVRQTLTPYVFSLVLFGFVSAVVSVMLSFVVVSTHCLSVQGNHPRNPILDAIYRLLVMLPAISLIQWWLFPPLCSA